MCWCSQATWPIEGEEEAYVRLRPVIDAALRRFGAKLLVAPGNHDDVALLRASARTGTH
jgi:hypothetical protein